MMLKIQQKQKSLVTRLHSLAIRNIIATGHDASSEGEFESPILALE